MKRRKPAIRMPTRNQWVNIVHSARVENIHPGHIAWIVARYLVMCDRLQACVQRHHLGLGGKQIDQIVVTELDRLLSTPTEYLED